MRRRRRTEKKKKNEILDAMFWLQHPRAAHYMSSLPKLEESSNISKCFDLYIGALL
jgi:hypothetical protein